jgi:hypothetical protein
LARETTARIGTALNSDLLVLGSYTNLGRPEHGQLRLDVRLQEAGTGEILAEVAEIGSSQDFFQLISEIGGKLRTRLDVPGVADTDRPAVLASLPSNPEATRLYSLGLVKLREYDYLSAAAQTTTTTTMTVAQGCPGLKLTRTVWSSGNKTL